MLHNKTKRIKEKSSELFCETMKYVVERTLKGLMLYKISRNFQNIVFILRHPFYQGSEVKQKAFIF